MGDIMEGMRRRDMGGGRVMGMNMVIMVMVMNIGVIRDILVIRMGDVMMVIGIRG